MMNLGSRDMVFDPMSIWLYGSDSYLRQLTLPPANRPVLGDATQFAGSRTNASKGRVGQNLCCNPTAPSKITEFQSSRRLKRRGRPA